MCAFPRRPVDELIIREKNVEKMEALSARYQPRFPREKSDANEANSNRFGNVRIRSKCASSPRDIYIYRLGKIQIRMNGVYK